MEFPLISYIYCNNDFIPICSDVTAVVQNDLTCFHDPSGDSNINFVKSTRPGSKSYHGPKFKASALYNVSKVAVCKEKDIHSDSNRSLTDLSCPTTTTEDSKSNTACGSSKRKRKLPVQYIRGSENTDDNTGNMVEDNAEENVYISKSSKFSILQADRKKSFAAFSCSRITNDDVLRSAEPQPKTTICYKPSPASETKGKDLLEAKENDKEHVDDTVRKMQEDLEVQGIHVDNQNCDEKSFCETKISFRSPASQTSQSDVPNVTVGQTYNLDLFRRIVGKSQIKAKETEKFRKQFTSECSSASHDSGSSSAWLKWMMKSAQPQRNCAGEQYSQNQSRAISPHQLNRYYTIKIPKSTCKFKI